MTPCAEAALACDIAPARPPACSLALGPPACQSPSRCRLQRKLLAHLPTSCPSCRADPGSGAAPAPAAGGAGGSLFDWSAPPLRVVPEQPGQGIAGLPGVALFGAHISSTHLVMLLGAGLMLGLKGLLLGGVICELAGRAAGVPFGLFV